MPVQTTYTKRMRKGVNGLIAWDFGPADITSANAEGQVGFGTAISKGTAAHSAKSGGATTGVLLGIAVRSLTAQYAINNSFPGPAVEQYGDKETVGILREGYIWITNTGTAAVVEGEGAFFVPATGALVHAAAAGAVQLIGSRIEIGAAAGDVALVRIQTQIPA